MRSLEFGGVFAEARAAFRDRPGLTLAMLVLAFCVMFTYGLSRPASVSMFLTGHGQEGLPRVWLAVAALAVVTTFLYNRFSRRIAMNRMATAVAGIAAAGYAVLLNLRAYEPQVASFLLYMWTDVYIVVLVEVFWSLCNFVFPIERAKWLYGMFLVSGSLGVIVGALLVDPVASAFGTSGVLWAVMVALVVVAIISPFFNAPPASAEKVRSEILHSLLTVKNSRYLGVLILLIAVAQVVITLIDYQYNGVVLHTFPEEARRAAFLGEVDAGINAIAIAMQGLAGLFLSLGGVPAVLFGIPAIVLVLGGWFFVAPALSVMVATKIASKALDYSLGRAAKEILYIPLSYSEKTQGKALCDVLGYRVAKGVASALLMMWTASQVAIMSLCLGLTAAWMALAAVLGRRFKRSLE